MLIINSAASKLICLILFFTLSSAAKASITSIGYGAFENPQTVGVNYDGTGSALIDFEHAPDGTPISDGQFIDATYSSVGLSIYSVPADGPYIGQITHAQALNFLTAPNGGQQVATSGSHVLSGYSVLEGVNYSGYLPGTSTIHVNFLADNIHMVGARSDLMFGNNLLTAFSGLDGTGSILGSVPATGPGEFFGLYSIDAIKSITFSGYSTEIDDFIFSANSPVIADAPAPPPIWLLGLTLAGFGWFSRRKAPWSSKPARESRNLIGLSVHAARGG